MGWYALSWILLRCKWFTYSKKDSTINEPKKILRIYPLLTDYKVQYFGIFKSLQDLKMNKLNASMYLRLCRCNSATLL